MRPLQTLTENWFFHSVCVDLKVSAETFVQCSNSLYNMYIYIYIIRQCVSQFGRRKLVVCPLPYFLRVLFIYHTVMLACRFSLLYFIFLFVSFTFLIEEHITCFPFFSVIFSCVIRASYRFQFLQLEFLFLFSFSSFIYIFFLNCHVFQTWIFHSFFWKKLEKKNIWTNFFLPRLKLYVSAVNCIQADFVGLI